MGRGRSDGRVDRLAATIALMVDVEVRCTGHNREGRRSRTVARHIKVTAQRRVPGHDTILKFHQRQTFD